MNNNSEFYEKLKEILYFDEKICMINEFEGRYYITNYGRIITTSKYNTKGEIKLMKQFIDRDGYYRINLKLASKNIDNMYYVHRLVAEYFVINYDIHNFNIVNHKDGNNKNNYYKNLEWCTTQMNTYHCIDNNMMNESLIKKSKLTEKEILEIYDLSNKGINQNIIAKKYDISNVQVSKIKTGRIFNFVTNHRPIENKYIESEKLVDLKELFIKVNRGDCDE